MFCPKDCGHLLQGVSLSFFDCFSTDLASRSAHGSTELRAPLAPGTTIFDPSTFKQSTNVYPLGKPRHLHPAHSLSNNRRTLLQELCAGADSLFSYPSSTLKIKPGFALDKTIPKAKRQSL